MGEFMDANANGLTPVNARSKLFYISCKLGYSMLNQSALVTGRHVQLDVTTTSTSTSAFSVLKTTDKMRELLLVISSSIQIRN
jgi:hypothetical protein